MPFELRSSRDHIKANADWLYTQEYVWGENHVTESLFKWFFFSTPAVQKKFLSAICKVRGRKKAWVRIVFQKRGRRGTPDAVLYLKDGTVVLFEIKIKQKAVKLSQLKRQLTDQGIGKKKRKNKQNRIIMVLVTPDFREPPAIRDLRQDYRDCIRWVPWQEIIHFLNVRIKVRMNSVDRLLRQGLLSFLGQHPALRKYMLEVIYVNR